MKDNKFMVWYKDYTGHWKEYDHEPFKSVRSASHGLAYVSNKFALNGQAGIFEPYVKVTNDLQATLSQLPHHNVIGI